MRIAGVESTDLFIGTPQRPLQVVRVTVVNENPPAAEATVRIHGPGASSHGSFGLASLIPGEQRTVEVPVQIAAPFQPGSLRRVTVAVESEAGRAELAADITVADTGWTMWMVSHFHYDPVWWNTQGQFTEARLVMPDDDDKLPDVRPALELVHLHLDKARDDADYKFVLAEIDYLKPFLDTYPERRAELRELIRDSRVEIVGGNYNEPNTNLTSAESTVRNAIYGMAYQRDVAGGDPRTAWMLDVFGHDPGYPGLMAAAGLTSTAWARGPFHQWGPRGAHGGGVNRMQFRSEFEWVSPDGTGLLTHYMAHHYGAGWRLHTLPDLATAEQAAYEEFRGMAQVAATRNVMLPVGSDHVIPANWVTEIHRSWNQRYVWPRFVTAVPSEFFAAVRADAGRSGAWFTPQTRDMNPVYTGKDVSCIDTKQAQRAVEIAVCEAERIATVAALAGAPYPLASLDKVWRILAYCAHHDAITGVEGDQVYLDLVSSWCEAWARARTARLDAVHYLGGGDVTVFNGLARTRAGMATATLRVPVPGTAWLELRDEVGDMVPALAEGVLRHPDGTLAEVTLTFRARDVPALGARTYRAVPADSTGQAGGWAPVPGLVIENEAYRVVADPARGGTLTITDKRTGIGVLRGPGNELLLQDEYAQHPRHGEGPWHLSPKPGGLASSSVPATVRAQRCAAGSRLIATFPLDGLMVTQETLLWDEADRVEFRTHVDGSIGKDRLLRVRFPADVPGGLPLYQTATAVIGRPFGAVDVDSADVWYTLDSPAHQWFGLGFTAAVRSRASMHAFGVAEVIAPDDAGDLRELLRDLLVALAAAGVTATLSQPDGARYGGLDADSNLPDVRIALGGADLNAFNSAVLASSGPGYGKSVAAQLATAGAARVWVPATRTRADAFAPNADVRETRDLPVLIVAGAGRDELAAAVRDLIADLSDAVIEVAPLAGGDGDEPDGGAGEPPLAERSVAVFNRGTPGAVVTPDGTLHMSLLRSCSAWPTGIWIDGERRGTPDGGSFSLQHWTHTFEYALASGSGDWRAARFNAASEDYNHDLIAVAGAGGDGQAPGSFGIGPAGVTLAALKPHGNPLAAGRPPDTDHESAITVRLRETEGHAVTARLRVPGGAAAAWRTDLLEEAEGGALLVSGGEVVVDISPFSTVTLAVRPGAGAGPCAAKEPAEAVQPVYARYWLHGKGPATAGNVPAAVHLSPTRVALAGEGDAARVRLSVACGPSSAAGDVELTVPDGLELTGPGAATLRFELAAGGHATWDLSVRAAAGAAPGRYFVGARIVDAAGLVCEDTAMVAVGEKAWPVRDLEPEDAMERMLADYAAAAAEIELSVQTGALRLAPGEGGELTVSVTSHLASELRAEAQLVTPFGSWQLADITQQAVVVAPEQTVVVRYPLRMPGTARPGAQWWALVKLMYFGRVWYTESVPVTVAGGPDDQ